MCFSAEASFTAAALLGMGGGLLIKNCWQDKKLLFLSCIPLFFALQQLSEGILWLAFDQNLYGVPWSLTAQYIFMFFAYLFWPAWIPFAYLFAEKVEWRRYVQGTALVLGMLLYCYGAFTFFASPPIRAQVVENSIFYVAGGTLPKALYLTVVLLPIFVSSLPRMWIIGTLTAICFVIADYLYAYKFASVWCFFSAIVFAGLYFVLKPRRSLDETIQK